MVVKQILFFFCCVMLFMRCDSNQTPTIRAICVRDNIGNYIIKWETDPHPAHISKVNSINISFFILLHLKGYYLLRRYKFFINNQAGRTFFYRFFYRSTTITKKDGRNLSIPAVLLISYRHVIARLPCHVFASVFVLVE